MALPPPPLPITGIAVQIVADEAGIQIVFPFTKLPPTMPQLFGPDPIDPPPCPSCVPEHGVPSPDPGPVDVTVILDELDCWRLLELVEAKIGGGGGNVTNCDGCDIVTPVIVLVPYMELVEYIGW